MERDQSKGDVDQHVGKLIINTEIDCLGLQACTIIPGVISPAKDFGALPIGGSTHLFI